MELKTFEPQICAWTHCIKVVHMFFVPFQWILVWYSQIPGRKDVKKYLLNNENQISVYLCDQNNVVVCMFEWVNDLCVCGCIQKVLRFSMTRNVEELNLLHCMNVFKLFQMIHLVMLSHSNNSGGSNWIP